MAITEKMTNRKALEYAIEAIGDTNKEVADKLKGMLNSLIKKAEAPKKLTAEQIANEGYKEAILDFLGENAGTGYTVSELIKSVDAIADKSNQKISMLMRALVLAGAVEKYTDKRRTYFKIVG